MHSLLQTLMGRCPDCGDGPLFERVIELAERCPRCGVQRTRPESLQSAAVMMAVALGMGFGLSMSLLLVHLERYGAQAMWVVVAGSLLVGLSAWRPAAGLAYGVMRLVGLAPSESSQRDNVIQLQQYKRRQDSVAPQPKQLKEA